MIHGSVAALHLFVRFGVLLPVFLLGVLVLAMPVSASLIAVISVMLIVSFAATLLFILALHFLFAALFLFLLFLVTVAPRG